MTTDGADQEVYLVPLGDETVLAIPIGGQDDTLGVEGPTLQTLIGAVGPLLGAALRGRGANAATYFELSPESLKKFEGARLDTVGSYFRGVLRNNEGQISHQVQLREVQASPAPPGIDPVALVQMAQMAALQAQLDRIEDTLADLSLSVERVAQFLETQQRARIESAIRLLRELHDRARVSGSISSTDWDRLSGVELDLETQLLAVRTELEHRLSGREFGKSPKDDAKQMKEVDPGRIAELVHLHRMLLGGLRGWNELLLLRKFESNELNEAEAEAVRNRLLALEDQHRTVFNQIRDVSSASQKSRPRSAIRRLVTDGLVIGGKNDDRHLDFLSAQREDLLGIIKATERELPGRPVRRLLTASPDDEVA